MKVIFALSGLVGVVILGYLPFSPYIGFKYLTPRQKRLHLLAAIIGFILTLSGFLTYLY